MRNLSACISNCKMRKNKLQKDLPKRAIVIDDDQSLRTALSSILKKRGYEVHASAEPFSCPVFLDCACSCPEERACANIIITDVRLPNMSGLEFIENQRRNGCKVQNIAVMSAVWEDVEFQRFRTLGCKTLTKPFKIDELTKWLEECEKSTVPDFKLSDLPDKS